MLIRWKLICEVPNPRSCSTWLTLLIHVIYEKISWSQLNATQDCIEGGKYAPHTYFLLCRCMDRQNRDLNVLFWLAFLLSTCVTMFKWRQNMYADCLCGYILNWKQHGHHYVHEVSKRLKVKCRCLRAWALCQASVGSCSLDDFILLSSHGVDVKWNDNKMCQV